ncbi:hypothetical protein D3C78_1422780 [compost metagenome]
MLLEQLSSLLLGYQLIPFAILHSNKPKLRKLRKQRILEPLRPLLMVQLIRQRDNAYLPTASSKLGHLACGCDTSIIVVRAEEGIRIATRRVRIEHDNWNARFYSLVNCSVKSL